jgi:phage baseplate assembly protein W
MAVGGNTPEIWSDLYQELGPDGSGALRKVVNIDAVKTSIHNILTTFQGERIFLPEFASRLRGLVFEPLTPHLVNRLSEEVKSVIERWDPRVSVVGLSFKQDTDNNYIEITVNFNILSYTEIFTQTTTITQ